MASMIPYAAGSVAPMLLQYGPTPAQVAHTLYNDSKWVAKKSYRAAKGFRKRKSKQADSRYARATKVGEPQKDIHMKREQTFSQGNIDTTTRTLYSNELTAISAGTGEDERLRSLINCKGIELAYHVYNKATTPMFLNMAVLAPKHSSSGVTQTDFFRSNSGDRGQSHGTALSALEMHYLPINTDKYTVLKHNRHQLGAQADLSGTYNSDAGPGNFISKKVWIPINRQLRYDNTLATTCNTPIYLAWWVDGMRTIAGQAVVANQASVSIMHTMFYTDVL